MSILAAALLLASGAADQTTTTPPPADTDKSDPMVCQTSEELGTRLRKKKVCMRRSEWRAQHLEEAQMINRTQVQRGTIGN